MWRLVELAERMGAIGGVPAKWALTFLVLIAFFLLLASFMSYLVTLEEEDGIG